MDDEVKEIREEMFDQIILGLGWLGLVGGLGALILDGLTSPWLLRAAALLVVVLVAYLLRRAGHFVVAAYVLVLELVGLVLSSFFQVDPFNEVIVYLFIPIILIAGSILDPKAPVALAFLGLGLTVLTLTLTGQPLSITLQELWPQFVLLLLTAALISLSGHYLIKISRRLFTSKAFLRERTLEILKIRAEVDALQRTTNDLKSQVLKAKAETSQVRHMAIRKDDRLHSLIAGTVRDINVSIKELEQALEAISERPDPDSQTRLLHYAWQQIDHLAGLTINLPELIGLETDHLSLNYQPLDLSHLLNELAGAMRGLVTPKNLELRCNLPQNLPPLLADPDRLRQALLQLLTTSIGWTDQGVIEVQIEPKPPELIIYISDTGRGLLAEELRLMMEDAEQGYPCPNLGIAISKRLVELHGGRLWATSVPGVGTTFYVALPLKLQDDQTQLSLQPVVAAATTGGNYQTRSVATMVPRPQTISTLATPANLKNTGLSAQAVPPPPPTPSIQSNLGPVARYSPVYITRFGLILLGLLVAVTILIVALAIANGPNRSRTIYAVATPLAMTPAAHTGAPAATQLDQTAQTPRPTPTYVPTLTVTAAKIQADGVALVEVTPTPTHLPTAAPTSVQLPPATTAPATPTPVPATQTPVSRVRTPVLPQPTLTLPATSTPVSAGLTPNLTQPTPTPGLSASPTPGPDLTPPPPQAEPTVNLTPPDLSFVTLQTGSPTLTLLNFDDQTGLGLAAAIGPADQTSLSGGPMVQGDQAIVLYDANGNRDLYLARPGSPPVNLTASPGDDFQPAWSPDGSRIAFSSGRNGNLDIYVMDVDGKNLAQLTTSRGFDEWPAWSPDGRHLAFVSDRDGNGEIYVMDADGQNQQRLTSHPADDWPVAWSPTDDRLVFASNRDGNWNLYLIDATGDNLTRLTNTPADERDPLWSPDGRTIAFAYNGGGNWDIYTLPVPTGPISEVPPHNWTQISHTPTDERYPMWVSNPE